jgi:hypothetical protein
MSVVWPPGLPAATEIEADGFRESPPDLTLRSQTEAGPAKARRRATAGPRPVTVQYALTRTQLGILDAFYGTVGGFTPFEWTHPRTLAAVSARFTGPPVYGVPRSEAWWPVTLQLEVLP